MRKQNPVKLVTERLETGLIYGLIRLAKGVMPVQKLQFEIAVSAIGAVFPDNIKIIQYRPGNIGPVLPNEEIAYAHHGSYITLPVVLFPLSLPSRFTGGF
jgi:hypothetical protein